MKENTDRWKLLCEMARTEQHPRKLLDLTREYELIFVAKFLGQELTVQT